MPTKPIDWRVQAFVKDGDNPKGSNDRRYRRINLMCYLLEDITYNMLYQKNKPTAVAELLTEYFLPRLKALDESKARKYFVTVKIWSAIVDKVETITETINKDYPAVTFRCLYLDRGNSDVIAVRNEFESLETSYSGRFCMPFLAFSTDECTLEGFLSKFGDRHLYELFTLQKSSTTASDGTPWSDRAESNGKKWRIEALSHPFLMVDLSRVQETHYSFKEAPDEKCNDPNDHKCNEAENGCDYHVGCFCSTVSNGECSVASCC